MGFVSNIFFAVCFFGISFRNSSAQFVENNTNSPELDETQQRFADVFIHSVINSHEFGKTANTDFEQVTDTLMKAMSLLKQGEYVDTAQKKALILAFCASIAEVIVQHCDTEVAFEEKTKIVTDALRNAYMATTGIPNDNVIQAVKFFVRIFVTAEGYDLGDYFFPDYHVTEPVGFPVAVGPEAGQPQFYIPVIPQPRYGKGSQIQEPPYRTRGQGFPYNPLGLNLDRLPRQSYPIDPNIEYPRHINEELESVAFEAPQNGDLPPIKWDGPCPKKAAKCPQSFQGTTPPLIVVSLDGFHPDYLKRGITPTLNNLGQCGVKADFVYPVFPSKTFPNHFSIVTGLNPPSHGIIDNSFYDPIKKTNFKAGDPEMHQSYWFQKDPIWVTAEKQGKKTASYYWFGSDVKINGTTPTYYKEYKSKVSFDVRVDQVLEWLDLPPSERPSFLALYVNQPDNAGHWFGPKSNEVSQAAAKVDQMIARLYAGLQMRDLVDCVNVVILSDHGMADIDCKLVVDIQNYMNVSQVVATVGPFGRLRPKDERNTTLVKDVVSELRCQSEHMRVYEKEQLPVRMHYADNVRIEPIFLEMDNNWNVVSETVKPGDEICTGGTHGYDNLFPDMKGIFFAHGPSIKQSVTIRPFINTEMYELFSELINITPNPNNGTRGSLHHILKSPRVLEEQIQHHPPATGVVPKDDLEYKYRIYTSNCDCSQTHKQVDVQDISLKKSQHLPFGVPYSSEDNDTLRILYNDDYVVAFDSKYRIPMWTAFTIDGKKNSSKIENVCWIGDARVPISDSAKCAEYNEPIVQNQYIFQRPLFPPEFTDPSLKEQAAYITNSIPKSMNHTKIIEKKLNQILAKWAAQNGQLNVVMGPAFDLSATGLRPHIGQIMKTHEEHGPLIVPTHIFVVATWCSEKVDKIKSCDASKLQANAFLLPNKPYPNNCESGETMIQKNVARVVDVENLTGLSMYTELPIYDAIRLRTMMPQRSVS